MSSCGSYNAAAVPRTQVRAHRAEVVHSRPPYMEGRGTASLFEFKFLWYLVNVSSIPTLVVTNYHNCVASAKQICPLTVQGARRLTQVSPGAVWMWQGCAPSRRSRVVSVSLSSPASRAVLLGPWPLPPSPSASHSPFEHLLCPHTSLSSNVSLLLPPCYKDVCDCI